ncbi:hypothetical protein LINGRAHAP2_LOCUS8289 [Linum grandiflorum]
MLQSRLFCSLPNKRNKRLILECHSANF